MQKDYVVFIGSPDIDENYDMKDWTTVGGKASARYIDTIPGGMIANAACVCAGMGVKTYMFDLNGGDSEYDFLFEDLAKYNVDSSEMVREKGIRETKCLVFRLPGGDRSIICVGNNKHPIELNDHQREFLYGAKYIYGSLWMGGVIADVEDFLKEAKEHGVKIMYDVEPNSWREDWKSYIKYADIVSMNEHALEKFSDGMPEDEFIAMLLDMGLDVLVLTLGSKGCRIITKDMDKSVPCFKVDVVDTTGCGDTFNSAFLSAVVQGKTYDEAALFANTAANMAATVLGPRGGITTPEKVYEFIKTHN